MPYRNTGRPNGRPKTNPNLPLVIVDVAAGTAHLNVPQWWLAMATLEAEWKISGRWGRRAGDEKGASHGSRRRIMDQKTVEVLGDHLESPKRCKVSGRS